MFIFKSLIFETYAPLLFEQSTFPIKRHTVISMHAVEFIVLRQ